MNKKTTTESKKSYYFEAILHLYLQFRSSLILDKLQLWRLQEYFRRYRLQMQASLGKI